jgi:RNA polymerase sigma factor (sigma-70 family)
MSWFRRKGDSWKQESVRVRVPTNPWIVIRRPSTCEYRGRKAERTATAAMELEWTWSGSLSSVEPEAAADSELLRRVRSGDEGAFRELYSRHATLAHALAYRLVRQAHLAEEIVQEAFLALWRTPERYDGSKGSVRSWLMGAVHNRAVDAIRRERSQRRRTDQAAATRVVIDDPAEDLAAAMDLPGEQQIVRKALAELPEEQRAVIAGMYFDGLTQTQIAERTGIPLGTVKSRTLLGMRRLRSFLGDLER